MKLLKTPESKHEWKKKRLVEILKYCLQRVERDDYKETIDLMYFDASNLAQELYEEED